MRDEEHEEEMRRLTISTMMHKADTAIAVHSMHHGQKRSAEEIAQATGIPLDEIIEMLVEPIDDC